MAKCKADYEYAIKNTILFSMIQDRHSSAYKREERKLIENLYLYLVSINENKYKEYGLEITETAKKCIQNYNHENGEFINYFNAAIARELKKAFVNNRIQESHVGIHIPENDLRIIKKYIRYSECSGNFNLKPESINALSEALSLPKDKILQCITDYNNSSTISDIQYNDDNEELSIFESFSSSDMTSDFDQSEKAAILLSRIDDVFKSRQERQKKMLSMIITAKISERLEIDNRLLSSARNTAFFNEEIYQEYCVNSRAKTAREIADELGISEQSLSRAYKNFVLLIDC